jgi:hypothetical protein
MMIYQEKIAADAQVKLRLEAIELEDRWVADFIDRLTGVVRKSKH